MRTFTQDELKEILRLHSCWLADPTTGVRADLSYADLSSANLGSANLGSANLSYANLGSADLSYANLSYANLGSANLGSANLSYANLGSANLGSANLGSANLSYADLSYADLSYANLRSADLEVTADLLSKFSIVPECGAFTGFKKVEGGHVLRLEVPEDAKRLGGLIGRKCRVSKAKVVGVEGKTKLTEFKSNHDASFIYKIGETVEVFDFCEDAKKECAAGIHLFLTKREAENYT